jgi:hypothetical protein
MLCLIIICTTHVLSDSAKYENQMRKKLRYAVHLSYAHCISFFFLLLMRLDRILN